VTGVQLLTLIMVLLVRSLARATRPLCYIPARHQSTFDRPAPPPLPSEQQREFEELVRKANSPSKSSSGKSTSIAISEKSCFLISLCSRLRRLATSLEGEKHPDVRTKPPPAFEGDRNPVTGEVGGPKTEPLVHGDWSFGGRATDF
jgi:hypothetical protein